jgi:pilus assembly protein Flp/PilA
MKMNTIKNTIAAFFREEDGAQVVEYALIIAVVSIGLVIALGVGASSIEAKFAAFVTRVGNCLSGPTCA